MKNANGSISIYFTFAIVLIISVILSITEIARINCQKLYLQIATDSAIDSMASLFHRTLNDFYNIYGVEYLTKDLIEEEYLDYMMPYFKDDKMPVKNWYVADIDKENVDVNFKTLTEGYNFEDEIIEYEKYKLIKKTIEYLGRKIDLGGIETQEKLFEDINTVLEDNDKSSLYEEVHKRYFDFADAIKTLEDYAKKIKDYINRVNTKLNTLKSVSTSGSLNNAEDVLDKIEDVNSTISELKKYLNNYKERMADFRDEVYKSKTQYELDRISGEFEFNDDIIEFIESEFDCFVKYVDEDSEMNKAIEAGFENCKNMSVEIDGYTKEVRSYERAIRSVEAALKAERKKKSADRDKEYIKQLNEEKRELARDFSDFLKDFKDSIKDLKMDSIAIVVSTTNNSSEENALKNIINLKNGLLLGLVLENEVLNNLSETNYQYNNFNISSKNNGFTLDKVLLGEYELDKLNYFNKELNDESTISGSSILEVERLIAGKGSDKDNLNSVVAKIFAIRIAMNVLHIYKSSEKRALARSFTMSIFGGFSPLLAEVMFLLVITAWGTVQGIDDLRRLMRNEKVKFFHDDESWTIDVRSIFSYSNNSVTDRAETDDVLALSYKDYLRILLMTERQETVNGRLAGVMELNVKREQENFDFNKLICSFEANNTFTCRHFFTNLVYVKAKDIMLYNEYKIKTNAYKRYFKN